MRHVLLTSLVLLAVPALAQQSAPMPGMSPGAMAAMPSNPYQPAEMEMQQKMMGATVGDASEMWTRKMIEHHRGAIAMSQIALRDAKDPKTRAAAADTIKKQEKDVTKLEGMLRAKGLKPE